MTDTLIYGADGRALVTSDGRRHGSAVEKVRGDVMPSPASARPITHSEARAIIDRGPEAFLQQEIAKRNEGLAQEAELAGDLDVAKRVRSQATSVTSVWDPRRGKPKPTPITWETLRLMANRNEWVRAIIKTRKNQLGRAKWSIVPKQKDDESTETKELCERVEELLRRPSMYGSRPNSRSWRQFMGEILEDLLVLDAGVIEKERDGRGWIVAMYPVDGATIRPNLDEYGGYADDAYVQLVDGVVTARFGMEDLVYIMDNPMTDVRFAGYGFSPLENLIVSVTADLYAAKYNMSYFEKGSVPEGLLNLGEDVPPEDVDAFRLYWMNEIMGKPWALPIVGGKGVEFLPWRENNRDMQFQEYQEWLLRKLCAVYQLPPQEVGALEDVNRSTADSQDESNESKSLEPVLSLLKDYLDVEVIGEHGLGIGHIVEFEWDAEDESIAEINAKYEPAVAAGAATRAEWRDELGMEAAGDDIPGAEGLDMFLADGSPQPLPSKEDLEHMGAKADAEKAQQEAMGTEGPGSMPWKPGDPNDPDLQNAQRDHAASPGAPPVGPGQPPHMQPGVGKTDDDIEKLRGAEPTLREPLPKRFCAHCSRDTGVIPHHQTGSPACEVCKRQHPETTTWRDRAHWDRPNAAKTAPDGHDRNPAQTTQTDDLEQVFARKQHELAQGLSIILGVPLDQTEEIVHT